MIGRESDDSNASEPAAASPPKRLKQAEVYPKTFADLQRLFLYLNAWLSSLPLCFVFLNSTLILDDASPEKRFCQQHLQSHTHCTHMHIGAKPHIVAYDLPWVESGWAAQGTRRTSQVHYLTMKG